MELWTQMSSGIDIVPRHIRRLEDEGWHGVTLTDSQNLSGEVYVGSTVAALNSTTIRLATG